MKKIIRFFSTYRRILIPLIHIIFIAIAYISSFYIRFDLTFPPKYWTVVSKTLPLLIFIKISLFYIFGAFEGLWRYTSITDIWRLIWANVISSVFFALSVVVYHGLVGFPRSVIIIDFFMCMTLMAGVRFAARLIKEKTSPEISRAKKRALIVGAGEAGIAILRECRNNPNIDYEVVGFIDDDPFKKGHQIYGIKVYGGREDIPRISEILEIDKIIIAIPSIKGEAIRDILRYCEMTGLETKILPGLEHIISGRFEMKPRSVKPEDLLGRPEVKIDEPAIQSYLKNKIVLITGAGGSIGSELCRQVARFSPSKIILLDNHENYVYYLGIELKVKFPNLASETAIGDIKDTSFLKYWFHSRKPQVVFHAAAHKHVPLMEENPSAAVKNNIIGTRNLLDISDEYNVERFVLISTDKAVNPTSVMGATKRIAEKLLLIKSSTSTRTKFMAVRFGNVLGSTGSVIPLFKKQIEEGGPITVTHPEVKRYFMSIQEAAQLVLQAGAQGDGGEIFILDMGEQIKILDLARNMISLMGLKEGRDIEIKFIGLRPGEKLYEEILLNTEKDKVTKNSKIYIAEPDKPDAEKILKGIRELEKFSNEYDNTNIILKLKELLPNYTPTTNTIQ